MNELQGNEIRSLLRFILTLCARVDPSSVASRFALYFLRGCAEIRNRIWLKFFNVKLFMGSELVSLTV